MTATRKTIQSIARLLDIMARLRSPGGCPWDAEQTPETLKPYLLEEAYEVLEAIDQGDAGAILDELGDLLLQVVFQARIFSPGLPSLLRARKVAEKYNSNTSDLKRMEDEVPLTKVRKALDTFEKASKGGDRRSMEDAFGELLFALVDAGRIMDIHAEDTLRTTLNRLIHRFEQVETRDR